MKLKPTQSPERELLQHIAASQFQGALLERLSASLDRHEEARKRGTAPANNASRDAKLRQRFAEMIARGEAQQREERIGAVGAGTKRTEQPLSRAERLARINATQP